MGSKEFSKKTFKWLYQLNADFELWAVCTKVGVQLTAHFNEEDQDGRAFPSCKYIADVIGVSEKTVIRAVRRMQAREHLRVIWGVPGRGHPNQYWMIIKPAPTQVLGAKKPAPTQVLADQKTCTGVQENLHLRKIKPAPVQENHKKENHRGNHTVRAAPPISASQPQQQQHWQEGFAAFWQVYPKQIGRREAEREFKAALEHATAEEIVAGARRYAIDPVRIKQSQEDDRFTKNPNNWLRDGRWADKLTSVTIDEYGNPVAQSPPQQNGSGGVDEYLAHVLTDLYPNGRWS